MSLSVFICSIFHHPSRELLHILFLVFILCRPHQWCSWCENTKGFTVRSSHTHTHTHRSHHPPSVPCPLMSRDSKFPSTQKSIVVPHVHGQTLLCIWLNYTYIGAYCLSYINTCTHAWFTTCYVLQVCEVSPCQEKLLHPLISAIYFSF